VMAVPSAWLFASAAPTAWASALPLHDALPILVSGVVALAPLIAVLIAPVLLMSAKVSVTVSAVLAPDWIVTAPEVPAVPSNRFRSEEHTSELQSRRELVCRLRLEKNNLFSTMF